ncbi:hypothetical protein AALF15_10105 [Corynebacteriaceae bacterium 7-707]
MNAVPEHAPCLDVDLTATPWLYPGPWPTSSGTLTAEGYFPGEVGLVGIADDLDRTAVVAVGSNASPGVMRTKLRNHGVSPVVPFIRACVPDTTTAFTAHVSPRGYIAAAPYRQPGAQTTMWVSFLDREQLECVDETEAPNYDRIHVDDTLMLDNSDELHGYDIYRSSWGLIPDVPHHTGRDIAPVPFARRQAQSRVFRHVRESLVGAVPSLPDGCSETVVKTLWEDRALAGKVSEQLHDVAMDDGY